MPRFILSQWVEPELEDIWGYIALDNIEAADRFSDAAYATLKNLARMPGMGRPRRFSGKTLGELRSFRVKGFDNYLIFYRPISDGIEVLHILHGARDIDSFCEP
jgi:toxin ParE1/3/4